MRLTVVLLAFSLLLVFFGTLDQVRIGIRAAQGIYFESLLAFWHYPETWPLGSVLKWIPLPLPGGYVVGPLLTVNLLAAHIRHFRLSWRIVGISLIHLGVLMLLIGQLITNIFQEEDYMWLDEGETANYVRSFHKDELYLTKDQGDGRVGIYAVPFEDLKSGRTLTPPAQFPFQLRLKAVYGNADIQQHTHQGISPLGIDKGIGVRLNLDVKEVSSFHSDSQRDVRTAVIEVLDNGNPVGTWLVSNIFEERFEEQGFMVDGKLYAVGMRYKKTYLPFSVHLLEFNHDRYPGTNIPSNFSSKVEVDHPGRNYKEEVTIFMNHPLRLEGFTFFQASFAKQDTASMFQVVRNPGWLVPYIACTLVSLGLLYQFSWVAYRSIRRRSK